MQGVSLTHPVRALILPVDFLLHIRSWLHFYRWRFSSTSRAAFIFYLGSFSYTSRTGFIFILDIPCWFYFIFSGVFLFHIPHWLHFYLGIFSYTSDAGFIFIWGVSLTHPVLALILSADFLLHISCWFHFYCGSFSYTARAGFLFYLGIFSYTSCAGFIFMREVSLTHPMLTVFMWGVSLTHPVLPSFYAVSFSYTSLKKKNCFRNSFLVFLFWGLFFFFFSGKFLLHNPCLFLFLFFWGVSLTHPILASFYPGSCLAYPVLTSFFFFSSPPPPLFLK